jgi:hypothetical protein
MAITQSGIFNASSTLRGNLEETNKQCSQNVANRERVITPLLCFLILYQRDGPVEWIDVLLGEALLILLELDHRLHYHSLG